MESIQVVRFDTVRQVELRTSSKRVTKTSSLISTKWNAEVRCDGQEVLMCKDPAIPRHTVGASLEPRGGEALAWRRKDWDPPLVLQKAVRPY